VCGIAGFMRRDGQPPARSLIEAMTQALVHRGPDGEGYFFGGNLGLGHRRLAIIDLETGNQPLEDRGGLVLIANAEIYNHVELRQELSGTDFATRSDCEPILPLYRLQERGFADRLRGMYALALYDPDSGELTLARDPFGIKPLYYCEVSEGFGFASEPSALIAAGLVDASVVAEKRDELLNLQFTTGPETIFRGIRRFLPGETIVVRQGRVIERRRREALPPGAPNIFEEKRALSMLDAALVDSIAVHQRADVPYGMFLSGGIDSATVLSIMAELNDRPVVAYTVGFRDADTDERHLASLLAGKVGAHHVPIDVTIDDFKKRLPEVVAAMDDPAADYACLPTYLLAERAARDVKVVLTGEGGDELFGGYGRYRSALRPTWLGGRAMRSRGAFHGLGVLRAEGAGWRDGLLASAAVAAQTGRTRLQAAQALDCEDWLPHDLLAKVDRCLMAHGVEGRTPFLDPLVANTVFQFDDRLKVKKRFGKYVLRQWLSARMPEAQPFAKKRGFTVPVATWMRAERLKLAPLVAGLPAIQEVCQPGRVEGLFTSAGKRHGQAMWNLLFYALWHQIHVLNVASDGDIFEVLAAR
jgi:asparagine synthase (glutamine-hydrolysing)